MELLEISNKELDYDAYIAIDSIRKGMAFGGCRFSKTVTAEEVQELASCMSLKLALHGQPVGGAKGGFRVDPKNPKINEILADFGKKMKSTLASTVVLGKDLGATDEMMDYMYQSAGIPQMSPAHQAHPETQFPNKLRDMIGYQKNMTGKGVAWATAAFFGDALKKRRAIIQGAGAVGFGSAVRLMDLGFEIVAISDKDHCAYCETGFNKSELELLVSKGVIDNNFRKSGLKILNSAALFSLSADVLILAAASNSVGEDSAHKIQTDVVVEGSNFGLTEQARTLLYSKNIPTIPDVIASSSSAAMVAHQMASGNSLSDGKLWSLIQESIMKTTKDLLALAKSEKIELRQAYKEILAPRMISKI